MWSIFYIDIKKKSNRLLKRRMHDLAWDLVFLKHSLIMICPANYFNILCFKILYFKLIPRFFFLFNITCVLLYKTYIWKWDNHKEKVSILSVSVLRFRSLFRSVLRFRRLAKPVPSLYVTYKIITFKYSSLRTERYNVFTQTWE